MKRDKWCCKTIITGSLLILTNSCEKELYTKGQPITDVEGNIYNTVKILNQIWMSENLKVTKFNDGTSVPLVIDSAGWTNLTTPGYCWYNNDSSTYNATYGALYNWFAVNTGKLCPTGWHVPADSEWLTLIHNLDPETPTNFLIGGIESFSAGAKLKEAGITHWMSPNIGSTNETGFTALPGGCRYGGGGFANIGGGSYFWSATWFDYDPPIDPDDPGTISGAAMRLFGSSHNYCLRFTTFPQEGLSVRCVKDQ